MKVSREKMAEHREQILAAAAKSFREHGFDGISVADLMKEVGLTHGGFYGHFESKEELVALASQRAMNDTLATFYLSRQHSNRPGSGCLFAAIGSDISRQPFSVRKTITAGFQKFIEIITSITPGRTKESRREKAITTYASMIGGMILARSVADTALAIEILQAVASSLSQNARQDAQV
jgi:TetR/AcrR family transcriptional regulator, transcriptional repressor for nem operon